MSDCTKWNHNISEIGQWIREIFVWALMVISSKIRLKFLSDLESSQLFVQCCGTKTCAGNDKPQVQSHPDWEPAIAGESSEALRLSPVSQA